MTSKDTGDLRESRGREGIMRDDVLSEYSLARQSTLEKEAILRGKHTAKVFGYITQPVATKGEKGDVEYKVTIFTGDIKYAGTDADIFITVIGEMGATKCQPLDHWFHDDFERGASADYTFSDIDIGKVEFIIIKMEAQTMTVFGDNDWFLDRVEVTKTGDTRRFPHNQWVSPNETPFFFIQCELTRLPQNDSDIGRSSRQVQADMLKKVNAWSHEIPIGDGKTENLKGLIPGFLKVPDLNYDGLNHKYKWFEERYLEYLQLRRELKGVGILQLIAGIFDPLSSAEEFMEITDAVRSLGFLRGIETTPEDPWLARWKEDAEFGRQTLNGMNPAVIKGITEIPDKFPVKDANLHGLFAKDSSLEKELKDGRMYMVDFEILEGIPTGAIDGVKLELAAAMALFYRDDEDNLIPLAIQLGQTAGLPIWTRNDTPEDWLLAKLWFRNADAQVAQICTHLAHTHFFVETFALGMHRCLMPSHPIHKMLKEHFRFIISIDTLGREVLIAPGGSADQSLTIGHGSDGVKKLLAKAYQRMDWDDFDYPKDLEKRGITKDLKGYHHKDDCVLLWGVIKSYVENMVKTFYENDLTVIKDWELQDWVKDVYENGFKDISSDSGKTALGLPWRLTTIDELVTYLQRIIFTCTVRHTYANFYTYQYSRFVPNSPTVMRGSIPKERGQATERTIVDSLPTRKQAIIAVATAKVLGHYAIDEVYLPNITSSHFGEEGAKKVYLNFREELLKAEKTIQERNDKLTAEGKIPYTVLLPSKIPAGIAV